MIIVTTQREGAAIMSIEGRLDGQHAQTAESSFLALAGEGNTRFIFDFSAMQYISSAGLRVVLVAAKKVRSLQGRLICASMNDQVRDVFEMSGFLSILETADSTEEALERLKA
ncbi:STAS domain-containing protein [Cohnella sp. LGH]|uniref:Anti-sigma factor antagonist n=1 Tax=Cohnella phaseoli TaxID=456490 RepID=A0A3D9JRK3_9BACL|nr:MULTISPECIES: STAS domain-containing protein [Cohnella]QTH40313.1 STAS domain-containing protein [Cohnella sp. LGH]RED76658.1 anti-sigma B factor antagonist/stage II sporulation protein AA (anti-sigma F factor antagonist) [Cohnella phaseoli]